MKKKKNISNFKVINWNEKSVKILWEQHSRFCETRASGLTLETPWKMSVAFDSPARGNN